MKYGLILIAFFLLLSSFAANLGLNHGPQHTKKELANLAAYVKDSVAPMENQTKVTDSAGVVKMVNGISTKPDTPKNQELLASKNKLSTNLFQLGDTVLYKLQFYGRIISIEPHDKVILAYTKNDSSYTKKVSITKIYTLNRSYRDYRIGEEYSYIGNGKGERKNVGVVVAVGLNALVVKNKHNILEVYPYVN